MATQCVFLVLMLISIGTIAAFGHSDKRSRGHDFERNVSHDDVIRGMFDSLMERLDQQEDSIRQLKMSVAEKEERIQRLETELHQLKKDDKLHKIKQPTTWEESNQMIDSAVDKTETKMDKARAVRAYSGTNVAFSTSMQNGASVHEHETVIFGHVILDEGHGYNHGDGIYVVPRSGVYVFTWSITSETNHSGGKDIHTTLMINGSPFDAIDSDADDGNWGSATGVVVVSVDTGDHVYIQVITGSSGTIVSKAETRSTFSGWCLF